MKRFKAYSLILAAIMLASCSSHGGGSDSDGTIYAGGGLPGSGGGSSSSDGATTTVSYTSYDSRNGYLNIDGGQYQTCTLTGNSQSGTITLSDGIKSDLMGSYVAMGNTANAATNLVALSSMIEVSGSIIEGCFTVSFRNSACTCTVLVTKDFSIIKSSSGVHGIELCTGIAARSYDGTGEETGIAPGSAEDPVNGTKWTHHSKVDPEYFRRVIAGETSGMVSFLGFENGYDNVSSESPYTISKIGNGYKICYSFWSMSNSLGEWSSIVYYLTIPDAGATECSQYVTKSGYDSINGAYTDTIDQGTWYKIPE